MPYSRKPTYKQLRRPFAGQGQNKHRSYSWIGLPLFITFLCLLAFITLVQQKTVYGDSKVTPATNMQGQSALCGVTGKSACKTPAVFWASMASTSADDIITAAKSTPMYQSAATTNDLIGNALQHGTLGTPVLVKPYRDDVGMPQKWIIPVNNSHNIPLALLTFVYDPVHQSLRASEFDAVTGNMFYTTHAFPFVSTNQASSIVSQQRHLQVQSSGTGQPTLIYYPSDHTTLLTQQNAALNAGGTAAIDPIWRITGNDGHYYYVDHLGKHTYLGSDLHVDPSFAKIPTALSAQQ